MDRHSNFDITTDLLPLLFKRLDSEKITGIADAELLLLFSVSGIQISLILKFCPLIHRGKTRVGRLEDAPFSRLASSVAKSIDSGMAVRSRHLSSTHAQLADLDITQPYRIQLLSPFRL